MAYGGAGQKTEYDHGDGWWNDDAYGTARGLNCGGEIRLITGFLHGRNQDGSHRCGVGGR